jgi:hypothetical protein
MALREQGVCCKSVIATVQRSSGLCDMLHQPSEGLKYREYSTVRVTSQLSNRNTQNKHMGKGAYIHQLFHEDTCTGGHTAQLHSESESLEQNHPANKAGKTGGMLPVHTDFHCFKQHR